MPIMPTMASSGRVPHIYRPLFAHLQLQWAPPLHYKYRNVPVTSLVLVRSCTLCCPGINIPVSKKKTTTPIHFSIPLVYSSQLPLYTRSTRLLMTRKTQRRNKSQGAHLEAQPGDNSEGLRYDLSCALHSPLLQRGRTCNEYPHI